MLLIDGKLQVIKSTETSRIKIWSMIAMMNYMLEFYKRNYKQNN